MVELHPHVARERVGTHIDDWHATMFQSFDAGETFQPWGDITVLYFGTASFELQAHTCKVHERKLYTGWTSYMWWHLVVAACSGHTLWSSGLHNAQQCNATSQLVVFTSATDHTWPHPTVLLGVVSGATDLNLSTHRGQCNNFGSIRDLVWSCSLTI